MFVLSPFFFLIMLATGLSIWVIFPKNLKTRQFQELLFFGVRPSKTDA
jgi:hypothetical protein